MAEPYAWQCFACGETNPKTASACATCGFPAYATGAEIAAARASTGAKAKPRHGIRRTSTLESITNFLSPLPFWRKCIVVFGALVSLVGFVWLKLTLSFVAAAWGIGAFVVGLALVGIGYAGQSPFTSNTPLRTLNECKRDG